MKLIRHSYTYLLLLALAAGSASCNKLLDVPPQQKLTLQQFWLSRDQAVAAVAGIYAQLGATGGMSATSMSPVESYIYWGDLRGDLLAINPGKLPTDQVAKENVDNLVVSPNDVTTKFTAFYAIINYANQALKHIPGIRAKDPAFTGQDEAQLTGEAAFLRAYAYFWLVRTFREVPLVLSPSETDDQDYHVPKAPADTLFARITQDLEKAKLTLPLTYANAQYNRSRATQYTAMAVLADVYLWRAALSRDAAEKQSFYDKAISNCDAIINSRRFYLLPGADFGNIFREGNTGESIFETYSNARLNNQVNSLNSWFSQVGYFIFPSSADDALFGSTAAYPDYRSMAYPKGPFPAAGKLVSYDPNSRFVLKYNNNPSDARWVFYRYADILLMKAEALAHRNPDDAAALQAASELVNQVRQRAFGQSDFPRVNATSTTELDHLLLDERGREFIGEGKRWFDLVRFASRDNFANKDMLIDRVVSSFSGVTQLTLLARISNPDSWYLPLNADALVANPNLEQNPYYQ